MTARKLLKPRKVVTEDAYGTPPVARSGMMKVAGATDDDPDKAGEQLITDEDQTTMKGPVYQTTVGEVRRLVRHVLRGR